MTPEVTTVALFAVGAALGFGLVMWAVVAGGTREPDPLTGHTMRTSGPESGWWKVACECGWQPLSVWRDRDAAVDDWLDHLLDVRTRTHETCTREADR